METLKVGSLLKGGEYKIVGILGQGGFGITYEAEQTGLKRRVAVKEFFFKGSCERVSDSSEVSVPTASNRELVKKFKQKFIREAQMIAAMDHDHIVRIYDVFEENGTAYYVMEYLSGGSLSDIVKSKGALSETAAIDYIRQIADALNYLHEQNTLHLDVKPSNVLLNQKGQLKLIDFGISKHYDEAGSQTSSTPVGISKGYAPLEQYQQGGDVSKFTPATDIYALGATLYYLVTGTVPPDASEVAGEGLPELPAHLSACVKHAITKSMSFRKKDRPQTIDAFLALLDANTANGVDEETQISKQDVPGASPKIVNKQKRQKPIFKNTFIIAPAIVAISCIIWFSYKGIVNQRNSGTIHKVAIESQSDSLWYLVGVNFGEFIKSYDFASSLDELNWSEIKNGNSDFLNAKGEMGSEEFSAHFKYNPDIMESTFNEYLGNRKAGNIRNVHVVSYLLGVNLGSLIKRYNFTENAYNITFPLLKHGIEDYLKANGGPSDESFSQQFAVNPSDMNELFNRYIEQNRSKVAAENLRKGQTFLKEIEKKQGVKQTSSGLLYEVLQPGNATRATPEDEVLVHYVGKLIDGTTFDRTEDADKPVQLSLNKVIKGWTEGLQLIGEGGEIKLYIPSDLAYGEKSAGKVIPSNSVLIFDVKIEKIIKTK